MLLTRGTFYWLWFVLFGVIVVLVDFTQSQPFLTETLWLLVVGGLGLILEGKSLAPNLSRPFDALVGILFSTVGWLGILHNFGINLVNQSSFVSVNTLNANTFLGLSLALTPALLHATLGFLALKFAVRNPAIISSLEVNTREKN